MKKYSASLLLLVISLFMLSCEKDPTDDTPNPTDTTAFEFNPDILFEGFKNPWAMVWLPDGRMLVTERAGEILVFRNDTFTGEKLSGVPQVFAQGQGGLLDIKLHPNYSSNGWIYITYAKPVEGGATTAVARFKLEGNQITQLENIFEARPYLDANFHFGSRIVFDNENFLYIGVGERGTLEKVQELNNDHGKVHRLFDDGRIPEDNPFVSETEANPTIWTYGHRNPQGMEYDPSTNRIWLAEHGPKGGDELNLIEKGKNYGWPIATYGVDYDGSIISEHEELEGVQKPIHYWDPSIAPCGMTLVTSDKYPAWQNNFLISALSLRHITRVELSDGQFVKEEKMLQDTARFRAVGQSPDGFIYTITENPGLLIKLVPR